SIDRLNPTVSVDVVTDPLSDANNSSQVNFVFSEQVLGFDLNDVNATGGALTGLVQDDATHYHATFTATDGVSGTGNVSVGSGWTDLAGNQGSGGSYDVTIDTLNPTVASITIVDTNANGTVSLGETAIVTITFSEKVTGFSNSDVSVSGGTIDTLVSGDGGQ